MSIRKTRSTNHVAIPATDVHHDVIISLCKINALQSATINNRLQLNIRIKGMPEFEMKPDTCCGYSLYETYALNVKCDD